MVWIMVDGRECWEFVAEADLDNFDRQGVKLVRSS